MGFRNMRRGAAALLTTTALAAGAPAPAWAQEAVTGGEEAEVDARGHVGTREVVISSGLAVGEQVVADNALLLARQFAVAREDARPSTPAGGSAAAAATPAASGTTKP